MPLPLRDNAPSYELPGVTLALIAANIIVFLCQLTAPEGVQQSLDIWGEVPRRVLSGGTVPGTNFPASITLFTGMFMHFNFWHIFGNMYALWLFGDNIEWVLGRVRFLVFYLTCGMVASLATVLLGSGSELAGAGASGAIAGVLAAYLLMYPRARITSLMFFSPFSYWAIAAGTVGFQLRNISAFWYIGSWLVFEIINASLAIGNGVWLNLGVYAHVGGAAAGALLIYPLALRSRIPGRDSPMRTADLTLPVLGDEGDGGAGREPVASLGDELQRIHTEYGGRALPEKEFHDFVAEDLIAKGDQASAARHCREMLRMARADEDGWRINGYLRLLEALGGQLPEDEFQEHPTELQKILGGGRPRYG